MAIAVAVVISVLAGSFAGDTLDMARVLGLLPFFVIGLQATPERLERLRTRPARTVGVAVMLLMVVLTSYTDRWINTEWLYYRARYDELADDDLRNMVTRLVLIALGTAAALAFLTLVPRIGGWFTRMGAWTLVVYLYHGFVVKSANYLGFDDWADQHAVTSLVVATLGAILLALFLAWDPVARRLNVLVDPYRYALAPFPLGFPHGSGWWHPGSRRSTPREHRHRDHEVRGVLPLRHLLDAGRGDPLRGRRGQPGTAAPGRQARPA